MDAMDFPALFKSWYNRKSDKAESIDNLLKTFETEGNATLPCPGDDKIVFTAEEWNAYDEKQQQDILMQYRLAYCGEGEVNWCEALGTVLANDEVVNGGKRTGRLPGSKKETSPSGTSASPSTPAACRATWKSWNGPMP